MLATQPILPRGEELVELYLYSYMRLVHEQGQIYFSKQNFMLVYRF